MINDSKNTMMGGAPKQKTLFHFGGDGIYSLNSNTTGGNNTANGNTSLHSNTTGANNTANGYASLYSNTTNILDVEKMKRN